MRKFSVLLSTIVVLALALTACGGEQTSTSIPSTNVPPVTIESTATEAPSATEAPATTSTSSVPVTGAENPSRISKMMTFKVFDQNGTQVGQVSDLVLDLDNSRVAYVAVNTTSGSKTVLVPWDSLQLQSQAGATGGQENAFVLLADPNFLQNAPNTDLTTTLPQMCQTAGNWDADIRNFWQSGAVPGTPAANGTATSSTGMGTGAGTETPAVGSTATAGSTTVTGTDTATPTMSSGTTGTGNETGNAVGQGSQLQGVILASQVIGSTINVGPGIGNGRGNGTGNGNATAMPNETATSTTGTGGTGTGTATPTTSLGTGTDTATPSTSGGTGSGTGTSLGNMQATVQDMIVDTATGDVKYVVISTADNTTNWIPVPLSMFRCDMANNALMTLASGTALQSAPFFTEDQFPDTSTTGWDQQWSDFWQNNGGMGVGTGTGTGTETATATATP